MITDTQTDMLYHNTPLPYRGWTSKNNNVPLVMAGRYSRFSKARTLLSNLFAACSVYSWSVISPICKNYHKGRQPPTRHHSIFYTDTVSLYQLENQKQNVIQRYIINKQTQFKSNIHRSRSVGYYRRWYQIESMFPALVIIKVRKCADKTENQKKIQPSKLIQTDVLSTIHHHCIPVADSPGVSLGVVATVQRASLGTSRPCCLH